MADVFISYAREDQEFVRRLHDALEKQDRETWIDWKDIPLTAKWLEEVYAGIERADTFAAVISPDSMASEICNQELDHAAQNNKRIVPIWHRDVQEEEVPEELSTHQYIWLREDDAFEEAFEALIEALDTDLEWVKSHTRLLTRAKEWEAEGRDGSFLLRGRDLQTAEGLLKQEEEKEPKLTPLQKEYILASRKAARRLRTITYISLTIVILSIVGLLTPAHEVFLGPVLERRAAAQQEIAAGQIQQVVRRHYEAIGEGKFEKAFGYFGAEGGANVGGKEQWIKGQTNYCPVTGSNVNEVEVGNVTGKKATARADVNFTHTCGVSHWILVWNLLQEEDGWKLHSQVADSTYDISNSVPVQFENGGETRSVDDITHGHSGLQSVKTSATAVPGEDASGKLNTYEPAKAVDGQPDTAWQVAGDGEGAWILLEYKDPVEVNRIGIIPGYDKVDPKDSTDRFYQGYIVRRARIELSDGTSTEATFERDREIQYVDVPDTDTSLVRVTILETYPPEESHPNGSRYDFLLGKTAISEIQVEGP